MSNIHNKLSQYTLSDFKNATAGFYLVSEKRNNHLTPFLYHTCTWYINHAQHAKNSERYID